MRLDEQSSLPPPHGGWSEWAWALLRQLTEYLRRAARQVNLISEGRISGQTNATTAPPTTGEWVIGDVLRNSNCTESGGDAIYGWLCVASGTPGTWVEIHCAGTGGSGTVTSVAQTVPAEFTVSGSPVTTTGTLAITKATQTANYVWAGPTSGSAAQPTFRALVAADLPVSGAYWNFGDGSDGDAVFDGTNTFAFADNTTTASVNDYKLTRAVLLDDCTINSGCTLNTAGYPFYVNGTLTVTGTLHCNGSNATTSTGGAGGGGNYYGAGGAGGTTNNGVSTVHAYGGNGGTGGASSSTAYNNGQATATVPTATDGGNANKAALTLFYTGYTINNVFKLAGGAGGMGGESTPGNPNNQGIGGGGGGVLHLAARYIAGAGTISANGGAAYVADTGDCGGGGGGGGGVILCMTRTAAWQTGRTVSVAGGAKSTGYADGTDGSAGTIIEWIV